MDTISDPMDTESSTPGQVSDSQFDRSPLKRKIDATEEFEVTSKEQKEKLICLTWLSRRRINCLYTATRFF